MFTFCLEDGIKKESVFQAMAMLSVVPSFWKMFCRLCSYFSFSKNKRAILFILLCVLSSKIIITVAPIFFKYAVQALEKNLISEAIFFASLYCGVRLFSGWLFEIKDVFFVPLEQKTIQKISVDIFHRIQSSPLSSHLNRKTGELLRVIQQGTKGIEDVGRFFIFYTLPLIFEMSCVCILLWIWYPPFFSMALFSTFVVYALFTFTVSHLRLKWLRVMSALDHKASAKSLDTFLNYSVVKYFHQEKEEEKRYDLFLQDYYAVNKKLRYSLTVLNMGQGFIMSCGLLCVLIKCLHGAFHGTMTIGDFSVINLYVLQFLLPLHGLGFMYRELSQAFFYIRTMFSLLELPIETSDEENSLPFVWKSGEISFHNVFFSYNPDVPILQGCSFTVPAGKTVALVGPTGAGKTTISHLLVRFFDPTSGNITIDGEDITHVTRLSLRESIGVIPQDTILFDETIFYNLRYGCPHATEEDIIEGAKKARIHDFIMGLPQGYETIVGERGMKLSGGEKQRLSIARVLIRQPQIFIFDEATSYLDAITEKEIQENIREITKGKTTLVIAHRLSIVEDADWIVVLHHGKVIEEGTHKDLLQKKGLYTSLWFKQTYPHKEIL